jgi:hypothetical protein
MKAGLSAFSSRGLILGITALVLDRTDLLSAPRGVVDAGQPTQVEALDEIVVVSKR